MSTTIVRFIPFAQPGEVVSHRLHKPLGSSSIHLSASQHPRLVGALFHTKHHTWPEQRSKDNHGISHKRESQIGARGGHLDTAPAKNDAQLLGEIASGEHASLSQ